MIALAVALCLASPQFSSSELNRSIAVGEKEAYAMLPPSFVCGPQVRTLTWSADSTRLLAIRDVLPITPPVLQALLEGQDPPQRLVPSYEIHMWDARSGSAKRVWSLRGDQGRLESATWLEGSPVILAVTSDNELQQVLAINSGNGSVSRIAQVPESTVVEIAPHPKSPEFAITMLSPVPAPVSGSGVRTEPYAGKVVLYNSALQKTHEVSLPSRMYYAFWLSDGSTIATSGAARSEHHVMPGNLGYKLDRRTGRLESWSGPSQQLIPPTPGLVVSSVPVEIKLPIEDPKAPTVWLIPRAESVEGIIPGVVSTDASMGELAPSLGFVAYSHQGSGMVRQIAVVSKDAYLATVARMKQQEAMNRAKQVGLALVMYAVDNDDAYPPNSDWGDRVDPYLKNREMLSGFNYTFGGGTMDRPAETELGFITGPGGRAVVYGDGHVKWIPN